MVILETTISKSMNFLQNYDLTNPGFFHNAASMRENFQLGALFSEDGAICLKIVKLYIDMRESILWFTVKKM
jgi:hypothetical protein